MLQALKLPFLVLALVVAATTPARSCPTESTTLRVGYYAHFEPVSYVADGAHRGYEADLLTAIEAASRLRFERRAIDEWPGIWLLPATPAYDIVGGGITALEARTRDARGRQAIRFTAGHIEFRQSLLIRAENARRIAGVGDLTAVDRVGVVPDTTGEARLLERLRAVRPQVVRMRDERALLSALRDGRLTAVARGHIGNGYAASRSGGAFVVTALDSKIETGAFALSAADTALAACIDRLVAQITDDRRIGYAEWLTDPAVFVRRAE